MLGGFPILNIKEMQEAGILVSLGCDGSATNDSSNLLDALRNARTEQVKLEISGPLSPVKVLPTEGSDFLYLVLPVRFKND